MDRLPGFLFLLFFYFMPYRMTPSVRHKASEVLYYHLSIIKNISKFEHITPVLKNLHWLPVKHCIDYKTCLLTYKTLQIQQPTYLRFIPYVQTSIPWVNGPFLSLVQDPGTPSQTPVTHLYQYSAQNAFFQVSLPSLASLLSFGFGLPTRIWFLSIPLLSALSNVI